MATQTQICNMALRRISEKTISSISENTPQAQACSTFIEQVLDEVLSSEDWRVAKYRSTLTVDSTAPNHGYDYRFPLPSSPVLLRLISVSAGGTELTDWVREGDYILTSTEDEEADIVYIQRLDYADLPQYLVRLVYLKLAHYLAFRFSAEVGIADRLEAEYARAEYQAKHDSGLQAYQKPQGNAVSEAGRGIAY